MTIAGTMDDVKVTTEYDVRELAGHSLIQAKPLFSPDGSTMFVPSAIDIRIYSTETGALTGVMDCFKKILKANDEIFQLQLHPRLHFQDKYLMTFSRFGLFCIVDIAKKDVVFFIDLFKKGICLDPSVTPLTYGIAISPKSKKPQKSFTIFFGIKREIRVYTTQVPDPCITLEYPTAPKPKVDARSQDVTRFTIISDAEWIDGSSEIAFSPLGTFIAIIVASKFVIQPLPMVKGKTTLKRHTHLRNFSCLACHTTNENVATGDIDGQIHIWYDVVKEPKPLTKLYHWHPDIVKGISFSAAGNFMYSVGKEATLVCWDLKSGRQSFRPRLGVPIDKVTCDTNNKLLALSFSDNTLKVIGTDFGNLGNDRDVDLEELSFDIFKQSIDRVSYDPATESIVTTGKPGELMFYSIKERKKVMSIAVIARNFLFVERGIGKLGNDVPIVISCFDVSPDGSWIVTCEVRDDGSSLFEERLKFWKRQNSGKYKILTTIHLPHVKTVSGLSFAPNSKILVTTSSDKTFKLWKQIIPKSGKPHWVPHVTCSRNNRWTPGMTSFSQDASLISVEFRDPSPTTHMPLSYVTFWDVSSGNISPFSVKEDASWKESLVGMSFATGNKSNFFVVVRSSVVRVWDLLTNSLLWKSNSSESFTSYSFNPATNTFICLTTNASKMYICSVDGAMKEVFSHPNLNSEDITYNLLIPSSALGVENEKPSLIFFDKTKKLFGVSPPTQHTKEVKTEETMQVDEDTKVPRGSVQLFGKSVYVDAVPGKDPNMVHRHRIPEAFDADKVVQRLFLDAPSHASAGIELLAKQFMTCLYLHQSVEHIETRKPAKIRKREERTSSQSSGMSEPLSD